jgi:transcriptional regulator with XRE-family HTH domain
MPAHRRIRERRQALGLSLDGLASRLQTVLPVHHRRVFNKSVLSMIESGSRELYVDELPYFARALECGPSDLLDDLL